MKNDRDEQYCVLVRLSELPEKMVAAHHYANLAEYILHELCDSVCLSFTKAAFLLDNPDFDHLKGITGIHHTDRFPGESIWNEHETFNSHMEQSSFNQSIRAIQQKSAQRNNIPWQECAERIAQDMVFQEHGWLTFQAKHGNVGLLLFEPHTLSPAQEKFLLAGASLLGLCPVF